MTAVVDILLPPNNIKHKIIIKNLKYSYKPEEIKTNVIFNN